MAYAPVAPGQAGSAHAAGPAVIRASGRNSGKENGGPSKPPIMPEKRREGLRPRYVPLPPRRRPARRPPRGVHGDRHRLPLRSACAGKSVLHPMGFDAFGLPAEEHAIKTGSHPRIHDREEHRHRSRRQLKMLGFSYDWDRELATTDVEYFRWTQWIFLQSVRYLVRPRAAGKGRPISRAADSRRREGGRARRGRALIRTNAARPISRYAPVNWCPALGTVLANEEVDRRRRASAAAPGRAACRCGSGCCGSPPMPTAWRRTSERLDWPDGIKAAAAQLDRPQHGGAEVDFFIGTAESDRQADRGEFKRGSSPRAEAGFPRMPGADVLRVYTTRPTRCSARPTWSSRPEHPSERRSATARHAGRPCTAYRLKAAAGKSDSTAPARRGRRRGVFTGSSAINPVNGQPGADLGRRLRPARATAPARSWPCPRTTSATSSSPSSSTCRSIAVVSIPGPRRRSTTIAAGDARFAAAVRRRRHRVNSSVYNGAADRRSSNTKSLARPRRRRRALGRAGQLQAPRLALQPAAVLGRAVPDPARARRRATAAPAVDARGAGRADCPC